MGPRRRFVSAERGHPPWISPADRASAAAQPRAVLDQVSNQFRSHDYVVAFASSTDCSLRNLRF